MESEEQQYTYTSTRELTIERLMADVEYELSDPDYEGRTHGRNDAYRDGCRGPLCRYRERTRKREAREAQTRAKLPCGVQPVRRTRSEQRWDDVIEATLEEIRTLGIQHWLNGREATRPVVSMPQLAQSVHGPVHQEGGSACGDALSLHLLQPPTAAFPVQRAGGEIL